LAATGAVDAPRFTLAFDRGALPRRLDVAGPDPGTLVAVDNIVIDFMQSYGIRAGALAVARDGRLVLARAYTWAEAAFPPTQPTSRFRRPRLAKPIPAVATMPLVERGRLALDDPAGSIVPLVPPPGGTADPRLASVTVDELLTHRGGWDRSLAMDPVGADA